MITIDDPWQVLTKTLPERTTPKKRKKRRIACGRCGSLMHLRGCMYVCPSCKGKHGAHPDGRPLGVPADRETSKARWEAHSAFDRLWKSGRVSRDQAYVILRRIMGMSIEEAHIGRFTKRQCEYLVKRLNELGDKVYESPYNAQGFLC